MHPERSKGGLDKGMGVSVAGHRLSGNPDRFHPMNLFRIHLFTFTRPQVADALAAVAAALAVAASPSAAAGDWPQFRGPKGDGVAAGARLPAKLDAQAITWVTDLP